MANLVDAERAKRTLDSMLTDYDRRLQSRQPNNYRLGHLFGASDHVFDGLKGSVSPALIEERMQRFFIVQDLPPARNFITLLSAQPEGGGSGPYLEGWPKTKKKRVVARTKPPSRGQNPYDQNEMAEYSIRRWNHLAPWNERNLTWSVLADRIRRTGDPGSSDTANAIQGIPGTVSDWALPAEQSVRKIKNRVLR